MKILVHHASVIPVLCIVGLLAGSSSPSYSQDVKFATKGITEIGGSVSFSSYTPVFNGETEEDGISILTFAPQIGYFIGDGFELGFATGISLLPGISSISPDEGDGITLLQLFAAPSYNFTTGSETTFPFIEGLLGYTSLSSDGDDASGFSYGGRGGVKIVLVEHLLMTVSGQYLLMTFNPEGADERSGFNYLSFGVGISGYF
jgi:hypothetical protein